VVVVGKKRFMAAPYYNNNNGVYQGYPAGYPPPPPPPVAQPYGSPGRTTIVYEVPVDEYGNPIGAVSRNTMPSCMITLLKNIASLMDNNNQFM